MTVSSTSGASGTYINIDALVQQAVYTKTTQLNSQQKQINALNTSISGIGKVKSSFASLQDAMDNIKKAISSYSYSKVPEGMNFISGQVGNYNIEVTQLAQSQISTWNKNFTSGALGYEGKLTINVGNNSGGTMNTISTADVDLVASDTLQTIKDKINDAGLDVKATILNGDNGQYLSFSSIASGKDNAFEITTGDSALTELTVAKDGTNYKAIMNAEDGIANVNGVNITSKDNDFKVGDGLEFTATQLVGSQKISIQQDKTKIVDAINAFVKQYNATAQDVKNSGVKDRQVVAFMDNFRKELTSGDYKQSVLSAGLSFDKSGTLAFDQAKFNQNTASLSIFNNKLIKSENISALMDKFTSYNGVLETNMSSLTEQSKKLNNQLKDTQSLIEKEATIYKNKYAQLDAYLGTLNGNLSSVSNLMGSLNTTA